MTIVSGIFKNYDAAAVALNDLDNAGITQDQISIVMTDDARGKHFQLKDDNKSDEGFAIGATLTGMAGAIAGLVMAAGSVAIPGLNLIVTGTLVSALAGFGAGAAAGGIVGALIGAGIPEHEAKIYEKEIKSGNVLLAVDAKNSGQKEIVEDIFDNLHANQKAA